MTTTEIHAALSAVQQAVDVPPPDRVAFQARVRTERRRRGAARALVGVAAAATLVAGGVVVDALVDRPDAPPVAQSTDEVGAGLVETAFLVVDGRLTAVDPDGAVHDLGQRSEGVVGWTADRVVALDDESRVTVRRADPPFAEVASPVPGPVQSVALSGDGRYLAWLDTDDVVHRYDLEAGTQDLSFRVASDGYVAGVSERGVLVLDDGALRMRDEGLGIPIPLQNDGFSYSADVVGDLVLVNDRDGRSLLYAVGAGPARLEDSFTGAATLGPFAERVAVVVPEPGDRARVEVWDGGSPLTATGLDGVVPTAVRWADETTLLVQGGGDVYACDLEVRCARLPVDGEADLTR